MSNAYDVREHYALGRSNAETRRLIIQAEVLRPFTARLLQAVGLGQGMRVLDIGCGAGDVAIMAAQLVGATAEIVGIDHNGAILETARERARAAGLANTTFQEAAIESFQSPRPFDLVIGRCVSFFQADPAALLRTAADALRPGGKLAMQEPHAHWLPVRKPDARSGQFSAPPVADFERVGEAWARGLAASAPGYDVALRLAHYFARAGLPEPQLSWDITIGSGPDTPLYALAAASFHSIDPQTVKCGIAGFEDLATDGLEERLRTQAMANRSQVSFYTLVSAWAQL